ncbi:hypothetical protein Tco_0847843 [Tanacetum coccineum]
MIAISLALYSISCHNKVDNSLLLSQFTSEKLLQQENEGKINIRIEMCWSSKAKKQFSDINSLLAALPDDQPGETVTFIKECVDCGREHPDPGLPLAPWPLFNQRQVPYLKQMPMMGLEPGFIDSSTRAPPGLMSPVVLDFMVD